MTQAVEAEPTESLAERLAGHLLPFTAAELDAAAEPHPHAWTDGDEGLFPVGEVSVIAAPGREGKTFATIALATSYALGTRLAGLDPYPARGVLIYSAEDDRAQYARKLLARCSRLGREDADKVRRRVIVPDIASEALAPLQTLVKVFDRAPIASAAVEAIIGALRWATANMEHPPGLVFFETASTLSEAEEDNRAFRVLIRALRRIARELAVAVVLVHHTSQAAASNLPDLNLSSADIRGGTALAFNARQTFLLVNLGSEDDPFPDTDARTVLREMLAPSAMGRVAALICLDSSKAADPAPLVLHWSATEFGPSLSVASVPREFEGMRWRKVHARLRGTRAERRRDARDEVRAATEDSVVAVVARLAASGRKATVRAVSTASGRSPTWAAPYLAHAVETGRIAVSEERVPRVKHPVAVYHVADSTETGE